MYHQRNNLRVFFGRAKIGGGDFGTTPEKSREILVQGPLLLLPSGWLLLFPGGLGMVAVISWWVLHG